MLTIDSCKGNKTFVITAVFASNWKTPRSIYIYLLKFENLAETTQ